MFEIDEQSETLWRGQRAEGFGHPCTRASLIGEHTASVRKPPDTN